MDAKLNMSWPIENPVPDKDFLFINIHKRNLSKSNIPKATAFKNTPFKKNSTSLSSNWDKYITAFECRQILATQKNNKGICKIPDDFFIWKMNVGNIRLNINPSQEVIHSPSIPNRAHCSIVGCKTDDEGVNNAEFRSNIIENGGWEIGPE